MLFKTTFLIAMAAIALTVLPANAQAQNRRLMPINAAQPQMGMKALIFDAWARTARNTTETSKAFWGAKDKSMPVIDLDSRDHSSKIYKLDYHPDDTARAMMGTNMYSVKGALIGTIEDILIDNQGIATDIIIQSNDPRFLGGDKAAFRYNLVADKSEEDGPLFKPISEDSMRMSRKYAPEERRKLSLQKMLYGKGRFVDSKGRTIANIKDVIINGGFVTHIIAEFGTTFGLGGKEVAVLYTPGHFIERHREIVWVLDNRQFANFRRHKKRSASL